MLLKSEIAFVGRIQLFLAPTPDKGQPNHSDNLGTDTKGE